MPGEADRQMVIARTLAQRTSHPGTGVLALYYSAKFSQLQRDVAGAKKTHAMHGFVYIYAPCGGGMMRGKPAVASTD